MEIGIIDKMDLEIYERNYNANSKKYKGMHLIKTEKGVLLAKGGKKIRFTDKEYSVLKELLKNE